MPTSTPITALTTNTADSHTRRAPSASATNDGSPGVSIRLIFTSRQVNEASDAEIDMPRACSSSSASETVVPSVTEPRRVTAPASKSRASCSEVFPLPRCPTRATLRILSAAWAMPDAPLLRAPASQGWELLEPRTVCARAVALKRQAATRLTPPAQAGGARADPPLVTSVSEPFRLPAFARAVMVAAGVRGGCDECRGCLFTRRLPWRAFPAWLDALPRRNLPADVGGWRPAS